MIQNVIFDLDGTLLNTIDDLADAGNWVCRRHGWPTHSVEEYKYYVGNGMTKLAYRFVPEQWRTPVRIKAVLEEFMPYYDAHKEDKTAPYPGVPALLKRLKGAGVRMAVLSNKAHAMVPSIIEGYFPRLFDHVQGAVDGLPTKPDPTLLRRLMEEMGARVADTLFVGDSNVDIRTAKNGGLASCGVLWGFRSREELEAEGAGHLVDNTWALARLILGAQRPILQTRRLVLREMTDEDFPALCRMLRDGEVMYAYGHAFSEQEAWDWLNRQRTRYERDGVGLWAVVEQASGEMVGQCGLTWQQCGYEKPVLEVGYLLEQAAWHKGYATEAARACRDYAFDVLQAQEVYSLIRDNNLPSQAVARRNGMEVRGRFLKAYNGTQMPHLIFSVRRPAGG